VLFPAVTVWELGEAEMLKSGDGDALTTRLTVVEWVSDPLVPVMVSVYVPAVVLLAVSRAM